MLGINRIHTTLLSVDLLECEVSVTHYKLKCHSYNHTNRSTAVSLFESASAAVGEKSSLASSANYLTSCYVAF